MAANPAAEESSGLATSAAGARAGGTVDPLDDVRAIFTTLGMTNTQCDGMINPHNLTGIDDFDYIRIDDFGSFVKVLNETSRAVATKVGMTTQRKLQGYFYWYRYQRKKGMIPVAADFNVTAMRLAVNKFDAEKIEEGTGYHGLGSR